MKPKQCQILIVGGGLAGLCAAIDLSQRGFEVTLIEPKAYPRHKVCGEYISNEVLPYLEELGIDVNAHGAVNISRFQWTHPEGRSLNVTLPLGGFGISRYTLEMILAERAKACGVAFVQQAASNIGSTKEGVEITLEDGNVVSAEIGIAAYGKRSVLDKKLDREFISEKANFMAAKWHARGDFPKDLVALHNFEGGYCGVSCIEEDKINLCFIASYSSFQNYRNLEAFITEVLGSNPHLKRILDTTTMLFEKPLSIAQISFKDKPPVEGNWLMCGDTAGLIHPLSGNGMSMAITSAKLASAQVADFFDHQNRANLNSSYASLWKKNFKKRLRMGRLAALVFGNSKWSAMAVDFLKNKPGLIRFFIKQTHGRLDQKQLEPS